MKLAERIFSIALTIFFFAGCDMLDQHPYDVDIHGERDINARQIKIIEENCRDKDTIRFVVTGDSQRWYDETEALVKHVNGLPKIDFLLHDGDLSDFGLPNEIIWQRNIFAKLNIPYVALLGNHDCLGTGEEAFRIIYGDPDFSFIAGGIKFLCLNTNAREYDYTRPIPNMEFIEKEKTERADEFDKTIVAMHVRPKCVDFNNNFAEIFHQKIKEYPNLQFCVAGHEHHAFEQDIFEDGIMYFMSDCLKNRNYYLFTVTPDGYEREQIFF